MRLATIVLLAVLCVSALGACGSLNASFVGAVDSGAQIIVPRYVDYVQADESLDADSKAERVRTAEAYLQMIEEAKKNLGEEE